MRMRCRRVRGLGRVVAVGMLCGLVGTGAAQGGVWGTDLDGRRVELTGEGGVKAVVLFFVASDCPISNREVPEMKRVEAAYAGRGVRFWLVYPNVTETVAGVRTHLREYGLGGVALRDVGARLARMTRATVTPEAAVLVPDGQGLKTVYVGRIDDRYLSIGQERPQASRHDLDEALAAVVAGREPKAAGGPAVGCGIMSSR